MTHFENINTVCLRTQYYIICVHFAEFVFETFNSDFVAKHYAHFIENDNNSFIRFILLNRNDRLYKL